MNLPDPKTTPGVFLITPIQSWYENGYFWATQQKWTRTYLMNDEGYVCYWVEDGKPELLKLGIKSAGQTDHCKCKECKEGRKLVKKGWRPEINDFGFPL